MKTCVDVNGACQKHGVQIITKKIIAWKDRDRGKGFGWVPTTSNKPFCTVGNNVIINQKPSYHQRWSGILGGGLAATSLKVEPVR